MRSVQLSALFISTFQLAGAAQDDHPYEETFSNRFTFRDNAVNFPVLEFDAVEHTAVLGATTVAVLARTTETQAWGMYSVDTAVIGASGVQALTLNADVNLAGACVAPGSVGSVFAVVPADGVYRVDCADGATSCTTSLVAEASDGLKAVTTCAAGGFSDGGAVVAVASPQGLFLANIKASSSDKISAREDATALRLPTLARATGGGGRGAVPPAGEAVTAVAVTAGWSGDGSSGVAVACSTKDRIFYGVGDEAVAADYTGLEWRNEWTSSPSLQGGAVDWPPAKYGLAFESTGGLPKLWIGGMLGLQALDLEWKSLRRLDGKSQGLPYENLTAVATGGNGELWLGSTMGLSRRMSDRQSWRYFFGARWLPGADGNLRQVTTARAGSGGGVECGGCSATCDEPLPGAVLVTDEGLAVHTPQCWTLARKAAQLETLITPGRHDRDGLVAGCGMSQANVIETCKIGDSDNDGLWTSIYTSSQIFKAATLAREAGAAEPPSADFNASIAAVKRHFGAQKKLFDVAGDPAATQGFMARSFGPYGMEPLGPAGTFSADNHRAWYNSTTYPGLIWKGDTSSDEVAGHMLTFAAIKLLVPSKEPSAEAHRSGSLLRGSGGHGSGGNGGSTVMSPTAAALAEGLATEVAQAATLTGLFLDGLLANNYSLMDPGDVNTSSILHC